MLQLFFFFFKASAVGELFLSPVSDLIGCRFATNGVITFREVKPPIGEQLRFRSSRCFWSFSPISDSHELPLRYEPCPVSLSVPVELLEVGWGGGGGVSLEHFWVRVSALETEGILNSSQEARVCIPNTRAAFLHPERRVTKYHRCGR